MNMAAMSPSQEAFINLITKNPSVIGKMDITMAADPQYRQKMVSAVMESARKGHQQTNDCIAALCKERKGCSAPRAISLVLEKIKAA